MVARHENQRVVEDQVHLRRPPSAGWRPPRRVQERRGAAQHGGKHGVVQEVKVAHHPLLQPDAAHRRHTQGDLRCVLSRRLFVHSGRRRGRVREAVVAEAVDRFGKLDILHNNAGGSTMEDGPVTEAPDEEFWRVIKLDLFGTFVCSKHGIPAIIASGGGSVINMSSNVALMALPGRDCYTAAKGGIASMTRSMAVEYAPNKIRVNAIAPSVTLSDRVKKLVEKSPEIKKVSEQHLLGLGLPVHIADMAVYLAADESAITTGQILSVDSGVTVY